MSSTQRDGLPMAPLVYRVRPLADRTWLRPTRFVDRFKSTEHATLTLLVQEVDRLEGTDLVIGLDVQESDIRVNGSLRARAVPATPAVEVAFASRVGPLVYRSDAFTLWQANVRAVALTLEALRAINRYGASGREEQYTGYRAIEPAWTVPTAWDLILRLAYPNGEPAEALRMPLRDMVRRARRAAHPDTGGSAAQWVELQAAVAYLAETGRDV